MKTIPVFYTISDDYTPYAYVSIQSLIDHADKNKDYTITLLVQKITPEHKKGLESMSTDNIHVNVFHIDDDMVKPIHNTKENYLRAQFFTMSIFYRLFIPELFSQYDKAVYLDADTIICTDIAELYDTEIGDNMFASCPDLSIRYMPLLQKYIKECQGILPAEKYINNGVILFNMKAFRDKHFVDKFYYLMGKYHFDNVDPDQAYMNEICEDKIYHLPKEWDAMPNESIPEIEDPKIVHYNLFFKPWHFEDVQYAHYFWDVAKTTPYYDELKQQLVDFTDEDRKKARADLEWMAQKVDLIAKEPNTWAKVKKHESVKIDQERKNMTVPVFYSISDDFTKYAAVSLNSLVKYASPDTDYTVYFLSQDLSDEHKKDLSAFSSKNVHVKFFHIDDELVKPIQNRKENFLRADFFTMSIFYRLFIPELFPQYDKAIYLDSDTVVNDDIAKLYNTELGDNLFGACTDSSIQFVPKMIKYIKDVLALDPKKYINSGMLVMNSKKFRDKHFIDHFMDLLEKYHFDCIAPDQDYLNEMGEGSILHLDPRWDAMPNENTEPIKNPGLIHYNLFFKPWHFKGIQYENYFWENAKETKFYNELKAELENYTDKQREDDRQKLNHMLLKEDKTEKDPNNWARVKEREAVKL